MDCHRKTEEEYKIEFETETHDLNKQEMVEYKNDHELNTNQKKIQKVISGPSCLDYIKSFYGMVECDIEIPEIKYDYFGSFPSIFKNIAFSDEVSGKFSTQLITH